MSQTKHIHTIPIKRSAKGFAIDEDLIIDQRTKLRILNNRKSAKMSRERRVCKEKETQVELADVREKYQQLQIEYERVLKENMAMRAIMEGPFVLPPLKLPD